MDGLFKSAEHAKIVPVPEGHYSQDHFLVRAEGTSMEPRIPNGSLCLFRRYRGGTRNDRIVLCVVRGFAGDAPLALIKKYQSFRLQDADSIGAAQKIVLKSLNPGSGDLEISDDERMVVVGILDRVLQSD